MKLWVPNRLIKEAYFEKFNFYFSKPVKEILAGCSVRHSILLKDWQFFDRDEEFIKKYYTKYLSSFGLKLIQG